ncbi:hypothetical protein AAG570_003668 [Ranatra chinensis]|uniref:Cuticle protein n=1 Tax=Ranatra chinensis TaxID=642074 RepID=A0ABD0YMC4_9HEMI
MSQKYGSQIILAAAILTVSAAIGSPASDPVVPISSYVNTPQLQQYSFRYESEDGTIRRESGKFEEGNWTVRGFVTWLDPSGDRHTVRYIADEQGYRTLPAEQGIALRISPAALASLAG